MCDSETAAGAVIGRIRQETADFYISKTRRRFKREREKGSERGSESG